MSKYYCEKHEYQPAPGMHFCPECETDANDNGYGLYSIRQMHYAVANGIFIQALDQQLETATALLRAIVIANANYDDTAPAIEAAEKWFEAVDAID